MSRFDWFRVYSEARTDKKLDTLTDAQHRVWFNLLCFSNEQKERGTIPAMKPKLLALEVSRGVTPLLEETIEALCDLEILDKTEDDGLSFVNWYERQYDKPSDQPKATKARKQAQRGRDSTEGDEVSRDVTPSHATEEKREENNYFISDVVEEEGAHAKKEKPSLAIVPPHTPPQYQQEMKLRAQLFGAAESLMTRGTLTKAHRGRLDGWLAQYKKRLTPEIIEYAQGETAGKTGGDALDYLLKVIVNRIENPNGRPQGGRKNGQTTGNTATGGQRDYRTAKQRASEETIREEMEWRASRQAGGDHH